MKRLFKLISASLALGLFAGVLAGSAWAQGTRVKAKSKPRTVSVQAAVQAADQLALARETEAIAAFAAQSLNERQIAIAEKVSVGSVTCDAAQVVSVSAHQQQPGKFLLALGRQSFRMIPVATDSGAIRLEDTAREVVWLQLANKSMLLDQRHGRRLADACMNDVQKQVAREMEQNPASHLLADPSRAQQVRVALQAEER